MADDQIDLDALAALEHDATPGPWAAAAWGVSTLDDAYVAESVSDADAALIVAARNALPDLIAEVAHLRRWKAEALPVMSGLQELGRALGVGLGRSITARESVDLALDLRNRTEAAERDAAALRERVEAVRDACRTEDARLTARATGTRNKESASLFRRERLGWFGAAGLLDDLLRAALTTGGDR